MTGLRTQIGRLLVLATALLLTGFPALAQGNGTAITVMAQAQSSIQVTFASVWLGCTLTPAPDYTNVILNLGTFDNNGTNNGCAWYFQNNPSAGHYTISSGFNVQVDKFNSGSTSYTASVRLQSPPPGPATAVIYRIRQGLFGALTTLTTTPQPVITGGTYGNGVLQVLSVEVDTTIAPTGMISRTIEYTAVAN